MSVHICLFSDYIRFINQTQKKSYYLVVPFNVYRINNKATAFALEKWPFKRGGLSSGVKINTFMFRFTLSSGLSKGGGFSSGCYDFQNYHYKVRIHT